MITAVSGVPDDDHPRPGDIYLVRFSHHRKPKSDIGPALGNPSSSYRETATQPARGEGKFIRQSGGVGQYGHIVIQLEPRDRGQGFEVIDETDGSIIPKEFIRAAIAGIRAGSCQGVVFGNPVVGVIARIVDGSFDATDSSELAFKMAGIFAFKDAMKRAAPLLFDPVTGGNIMLEDREARPAVVVSRLRSTCNEPVICVPLTTRQQHSRYEVTLGKLEFLEKEFWAYVEGVAGFGPEELVRRLGQVSFAQFQEIKAALKLAQDL